MTQRQRFRQGAQDPNLFMVIPPVETMAWLVQDGAPAVRGQWVTVVSHANDETVIVRGSLGSTFQWPWKSLYKKAPDAVMEKDAVLPHADIAASEEVATGPVSLRMYVVTGSPRDAQIWRYSYGDNAYTTRIADSMNMYHALAVVFALNTGALVFNETSAPIQT